MTNHNIYDVIIVGGSYAGLAAAMSLGRAMRKVLVIDDGKPCNRQTPHSHNFLTNDGRTPAEIGAIAKWQVLQYPTVQFVNGTALYGQKTLDRFQVGLATGESFAAQQLIFATGIKDLLPPIIGLAECWGISVIHCPFCHGYEVRQANTGILGTGDMVFDFTRLISNWTNNLTVFSNGPASFTLVQMEQLHQHNIGIVEKEIDQLVHKDGQLQMVLFRDGSTFPLEALYAPSPFEQHCRIPESLGCALTGEGYIETDSTQESTVPGVYAIGDNAAKMRTVANAVAMGTATGILLSKKLILAEF